MQYIGTTNGKLFSECTETFAATILDDPIVQGKKNSSWVSTYDQNDPATVAELQIIIFLERTYFRLSRRFGRTKKCGQTQSRAH